MRDFTHEFRQRGSDPEMARHLAHWRDQFIQDMLTDKSDVAYCVGQFIKGALLADPAAARWCRANEIPITRASATQPNSGGGVLAFDEMADAVLLLTDSYGVLRQHASVWRLSSDSLIVPRNTSSMSMGWVSEASTISQTTPNFDGLQLSCRKLAGYLKIPNELMTDSLALGKWFVAASAQGIAKQEDLAGFLGDGSSAFGGVVGLQSALAPSAKVTASSGTFASLTGTDVGAIVAALPARALPNARFFVSMAGYGAFVRLSGANGGLVATIENGKLQANFHGIPVTICAALPSTGSVTSGKMMMCVGDLQQAIAYGARRDLSLMAFTEFAADVDQTLIRITERLDITAHDTGSAGDGSAIIGLVAP